MKINALIWFIYDCKRLQCYKKMFCRKTHLNLFISCFQCTENLNLFRARISTAWIGWSDLPHPLDRIYLILREEGEEEEEVVVGPRFMNPNPWSGLVSTVHTSTTQGRSSYAQFKRRTDSVLIFSKNHFPSPPPLKINFSPVIIYTEKCFRIKIKTIFNLGEIFYALDPIPGLFFQSAFII